MKRLALVCAIFCMLSQGLAGAGEGPGILTFERAMALAAQRNPGVLMADERVKQSVERFSQARSILSPQLSGTVSETRQTRNLQSIGIPPPAGSPSRTPPFNTFDARLKLTQTLFDLAAIGRLQAAAEGKTLSAADARKVREDAMALVGSLYVDAERARESLEFTKALVRLDAQKYRVAQARLSAGAGSASELEAARADLEASRHDWRTAEGNAGSTLADLKAALGMSDAERLLIGETQQVPNLRLPERGVVEGALKDHPELAAAEAEGRVRNAEESAARAELWPKISGSGDYGATGESPSGTESTYFVGVEATLPIFDGGERIAKTAEAGSRSREAQVHLEDVKRSTGNEASQARDALKQARRLVDAQRRRLIQMDHELAISAVGLKNGTTSRLNWIRASAAEAQAQDNYREAVAVQRSAQIRYAHALGIMDRFLEKGGLA